jgi:hypothetical protein
MMKHPEAIPAIYHYEGFLRILARQHLLRERACSEYLRITFGLMVYSGA